MNAPNDTSAEADRVLTAIHRNMSFAQKWRRLGELYRTAKTLHATGVQMRHPHATPAEIHSDWLRLTLGEATARRITEGRPRG